MSNKSHLKICPICKLKFHARGLLGHLRLLHGISLKNITQVSTLTSTYLGDLSDTSLKRYDLSQKNAYSYQSIQPEIKEKQNIKKDELAFNSKTISRPVEKTITGTFPSGTDTCLGCSKHFWISEMKPGHYAPQCLYCYECYERMLYIK